MVRHESERQNRERQILVLFDVERQRSYECGKAGNLISLCDLLKPGENADGRPRGERFKEIASDLQAMSRGATKAEAQQEPSAKKPTAPEPPKINIPLAKSDNERARALVDLDRKFVVEPADIPPAASAYFRRRPFLTPEVCRKWRVRYLPRNVGGEIAGRGSHRGRGAKRCDQAGDVRRAGGRIVFKRNHSWRNGSHNGRVTTDP